MDDLTMTRLCAQAMGLSASEWSHMVPPPSATSVPVYEPEQGRFVGFDPLTNDAQAMALVKKFRLYLEYESDSDEWFIGYPAPGSNISADNTDLNRAICECVAKLSAEVLKERG
jgi:hypothetical protein